VSGPVDFTEESYVVCRDNIPTGELQESGAMNLVRAAMGASAIPFDALSCKRRIEALATMSTEPFFDGLMEGVERTGAPLAQLSRKALDALPLVDRHQIHAINALAKDDYENLPGWATWTAQEADDYIDTNVTDLASAKVVMRRTSVAPLIMSSAKTGATD